MSEQSPSPQEMTSPSIMSHVSVGSNRLAEAIGFYDKVLATLGATRVHEVPGMAVAWGKQFPEFWVQLPYNGERAEIANGVHFAFLAENRAMVDAFYKAGIDEGATDDGEPGPRQEYGEAYYGCFLRDLDGHKIEAMYWDVTKAAGAEA